MASSCSHMKTIFLFRLFSCICILIAFYPCLTLNKHGTRIDLSNAGENPRKSLSSKFTTSIENSKQGILNERIKVKVNAQPNNQQLRANPNDESRIPSVTDKPKNSQTIDDDSLRIPDIQIPANTPSNTFFSSEPSSQQIPTDDVYHVSKQRFLQAITQPRETSHPLYSTETQHDFEENAPYQSPILSSSLPARVSPSATFMQPVQHSQFGLVSPRSAHGKTENYDQARADEFLKKADRNLQLERNIDDAFSAEKAKIGHAPRYPTLGMNENEKGVSSGKKENEIERHFTFPDGFAMPPSLKNSGANAKKDMTKEDEREDGQMNANGEEKIEVKESRYEVGNAASSSAARKKKEAEETNDTMTIDSESVAREKFNSMQENGRYPKREVDEAIQNENTSNEEHKQPSKADIKKKEFSRYESADELLEEEKLKEHLKKEAAEKSKEPAEKQLAKQQSKEFVQTAPPHTAIGSSHPPLPRHTLLPLMANALSPSFDDSSVADILRHNSSQQQHQQQEEEEQKMMMKKRNDEIVGNQHTKQKVNENVAVHKMAGADASQPLRPLSSPSQFSSFASSDLPPSSSLFDEPLPPLSPISIPEFPSPSSSSSSSSPSSSPSTSSSSSFIPSFSTSTPIDPSTPSSFYTPFSPPSHFSTPFYEQPSSSSSSSPSPSPSPSSSPSLTASSFSSPSKLFSSVPPSFSTHKSTTNTHSEKVVKSTDPLRSSSSSGFHQTLGMEQNFPLSASSSSSPSSSSQPPKLSDVSAIPSMTPQTASFSSFALRNQQFNVQQPLFAAPSPYSLPSTALSSLTSSSSASPSYSSSSLGSKTQKKISCAYDIDCRPGEMCIKPDGACWNSSIEGVCGYAPDVCEDDVTLGEKEMKALMKGKLVIEGEEEVMAEKEAMEREKEKASEKERRERRAREEREKREEKEERQRRRDTGEGDADAVVLNTNPTGQTFCGCDGADYTSRCQALKNRVNVDFVGKCADKIPSQLKDEHTNSRDVTDFRRFGYRDTSRPTRSSARDASSFFPTQPSASLYSSPSSYSSSRSPSSPSPSPSSSSYLSSSPYSSPSPTKDTNGYYLKPNSHSSYQTPRYKSPSYSSPSSSYRPSHSSSRSRSDERGEPAVFSETPPSSVYKPSPRIVGKKSAK